MSIFKINESRFLIFGLGTSGKGAIKLLEKYYCDYCVYDDDEEKLKEFDKDKISNCFELFDYVVVSPSVNVTDKKANLISEIDLGFLFLKYLNIQATVIGVTGTCGKTTTVKMIENFLMSDGKRVAVAGNIGLSFCELLTINTNFDYLVLELSSFQLKNSLNVCCDYSIITNVTPNHLDIHNGYEDYFNSK